MTQSENNDPTDALSGNKFFCISLPESGKNWSVSEDYRFVSLFHLMNGNMLPDPAHIGDNGEYIFNRTGVDAIRKELVRGRGVAVAFLADQSLPGQMTGEDAKYMKFSDKDGNPSDNTLADIWAQYTYDIDYDPSDPTSVNKTLESNHVVCIVGYDDNFPKEFFYDPNGTIGGDGAFLAKNSWAHYDAGDPDSDFLDAWGTGGSGYFWISYYDQSLNSAESFDFDTGIETRGVFRNIDMYDFLPDISQTSLEFDNDIYMANVFEAKSNCSVRFIGLELANGDTDVEYSVYLLDILCP